MKYYDPRKNYAEVKSEDIIAEVAKERGYTTEPRKKRRDQGKYHSNGSVRHPLEKRQEYFRPDGHGFSQEYLWSGSKHDYLRLVEKRVFDTEEASRKAALMMDIKVQIMLELMKIDRDWEPDWEDDDQCKYCITYIAGNNNFDSYSDIYFRKDVTYLSLRAVEHLLSEKYTDFQRACFMEDVELFEKYKKQI